ncbi:MAG TPA: hypothetical protein VFR85_01615 [Anaeromyxobacteraceae bacterium]|nr:hypothetical protein [Anaeromyxobacteraceae bacterium]
MSGRSAEPRSSAGTSLGAALTALALCAAARAEVPSVKRTIDIDVIPGPLGAVRLPHAAHVNVGWKADRSPMTCRDCHHALQADQPTSPSDDLRCSGCHPAVGEPDRVIGGKRARAMARLKPDGAIDYRTILFHDYCRGCHRKVQGGELRLTHCKLCHPRGIGEAALHGRFDGVRQEDAHLVWLRCPAGQRWNGTGCQGDTLLASRAEAAHACPEGCRLPSPEEFAAILAGCAKAAEDGERSCRPCAESPACLRLLGPDAGTYWAAAPEEPGWMARLSDGAFVAAPRDARALVRCVQAPPGGSP